MRSRVWLIVFIVPWVAGCPTVPTTYIPKIGKDYPPPTYTGSHAPPLTETRTNADGSETRQYQTLLQDGLQVPNRIGYFELTGKDGKIVHIWRSWKEEDTKYTPASDTISPSP